MFLTEDVQKAQQFGEFLHKHAKWELSTSDAITLTKFFAWYNGVVKKIDEHVLELQRTFKAPETEAKEPEAKKKAK